MKPNCIDCNKLLSRYDAKRCWECRVVYLKDNATGGEMGKSHYCKEKHCNNKISYHSWKYWGGRCKSCSRKGKLHWNYGNKKERLSCIDCGKRLSKYSYYNRSKRCPSCSVSDNMKKNWQLPEFRNKVINSHLGYITPKKQKEKQRQSCINFWKNCKYKDKLIKKILRGQKIKPNKPEKVLNSLLKVLLLKEYKYVGNGQIIIGGFNPDFINVNGQKKIIELYGDYWHNRPEWKKRDKRRIKSYRKYGYKLLIVWEHELKNVSKLKDKILEFNKENK